MIIIIAKMVQQQNAMARPIVPSFEPKSTNLATVAAGAPTNQIILIYELNNGCKVQCLI